MRGLHETAKHLRDVSGLDGGQQRQRSRFVRQNIRVCKILQQQLHALDVSVLAGEEDRRRSVARCEVHHRPKSLTNAIELYK